MESSAVAFRLTLRQESQVRDFRRNEQHRRGIRAGSHTGAASNARGGFHRKIRIMFGYRQRVCFRGGSGSSNDVAAGLDDAVKGASVDYEILDRREGGGAERLNPDGISFLESPHIKVAG